MTDVTYSKGELFTSFYSASAAGDIVMRELVEQNEGSNAVFTIHADAVIAQMRKMGYTVRATKVSKSTLAEIDALFEELSNENPYPRSSPD